MQKYLLKSLIRGSLLSSLLVKNGSSSNITDWENKPESWPDIRENVKNNSIRLLADDRYNLGFKVTCTGGYSVDIDGTHYQDYASDAQFSMNKANWPNTGYTIDYPSGATKAHIIDIYPITEGNDLITFTSARVASSGQETQGILWEHFATKNPINLARHLYKYGEYYSNMTKAVTAENNILKCGNNDTVFYRGISLDYIPTITSYNNGVYFGSYFQGCSVLPQVILKNITMLAPANAFNECYNLQQIKYTGLDFSGLITSVNSMFKGCRSLVKIPDFIKWNNITNGKDFITEAANLADTVLDVSAAKGLKIIGCYGTSNYFMTGFKGLRVSNQAPFNDSTAPQINVSYTGIDRQALVTLFNDLPTVTGGQVINVTGCTGTSDLTADDKAIATAKGWAITL